MEKKDYIKIVKEINKITVTDTCEKLGFKKQHFYNEDYSIDKMKLIQEEYCNRLFKTLKKYL